MLKALHHDHTLSEIIPKLLLWEFHFSLSLVCEGHVFCIIIIIIVYILP